MKKLPTEKTIINDIDGIILTEKRLRYVKKRRIYSVLLEEIASIEYSFQNQPLYLILALIAIAASVYIIAAGGPEQGAIFSGVIGIILIVIYLWDVRRLIVVTSRGNSTLKLKAGSKEKVIDFIDKVEELQLSHQTIGQIKVEG